MNCDTCKDTGTVTLDVECEMGCADTLGGHHTLDIDCPCCSDEDEEG
jgi:hypothetical protein